MASTENLEYQLQQLATMVCQFGNDAAQLLGSDHKAVECLADAVASIVVARAKIVITRQSQVKPATS
jgi:hypothetical protein